VLPVPVEVIVSGYLVNVQVPDEGKSLNTTLPVGKVHVGAVIVPTVGAGGLTGGALITIFPVGTETHPDSSVTVNV
jgi:hypothetical protein